MEQNKGAGFAIASMVLGIVSLVLSCCVPSLTFILAIVAIILSSVSMGNKMDGRGMAIAGLVTAIVSMIPAIYMIILGASLLATTGM